jgi:DNA polymerase I-like protein with 3'-5' exonuclease and polymerase domains
MALAYVDWSQQEFGIAAALSGDPAMMAAYESGDPYLAFAKQAGRVPEDGTKHTHAVERELFKACVLGVQYGMGEVSLARRIGKPVAYARDLIRLHHTTYPKFWKWSEGAEVYAMLLGRLHTVFNWIVHARTDSNPRSLRNFPCQANGAEMMRLGCLFALERGVSVLAPIHDALLVEGLEWEMEDVVASTQAEMSDASAAVLGGFRLRSNAENFYWPNRYMDGRGREFWKRVEGLLEETSYSGTIHASRVGAQAEEEYFSSDIYSSSYVPPE